MKEKTYFDGKKQVILYKDSAIQKGEKKAFKDKEYKFLLQQLLDKDITIDEYKFKKNSNLKRSQRNTLNMIYDISRSNEWELFVTLTFDPNKVDSFNYDDVTKKLQNWLIVQRRNCKDLKYIIVPELHKSGRFHFHGLFANCSDIRLVDGGKRDKKGRIIYNIDNYKLGWSTATKVENTDAVNKYIAKYCTKELFKVTSNKKRYWRSRNCDLPSIKELRVDPAETIKNLDNSHKLLSKQVKVHKYKNHAGKEVESTVIYYEFDKS